MRYEKLDALRGMTFISMFFYHALWDVNYIFGHPMAWYSGLPGYIWQQSICITFIFLSGFCLRLGTHGLRRGIIVSLAGAAITALTARCLPEDIIIFGVLTLIGACMIILTILRRPMEKFPAWLGVILNLLLFIGLRSIGSGRIGFGAHTLQLPPQLYRNYLTASFGFPFDGFYSTDYFPLLPWIFLFAAGFYLCQMVREGSRMRGLAKCDQPFRKFIGRHSLIFYLLHQPVIYAVLSLLFTGSVAV